MIAPPAVTLTSQKTRTNYRRIATYGGRIYRAESVFRKRRIARNLDDTFPGSYRYSRKISRIGFPSHHRFNHPYDFEWSTSIETFLNRGCVIRLRNVGDFCSSNRATFQRRRRAFVRRVVVAGSVVTDDCAKRARIRSTFAARKNRSMTQQEMRRAPTGPSTFTESAFARL